MTAAWASWQTKECSPSHRTAIYLGQLFTQRGATLWRMLQKEREEQNG